MRVVGGLVQEQIVDHDAFHGRQAGGHMLGVGIRLQDVLALDDQGLKLAVHRRVEHIGDAQAGLVIQRHAPVGLEQGPRLRVRDMTIAGQLVRERAHVA